MARIVVIGASQGIGLETTTCALAAGHEVVAFARRASGIGLDSSRLTKFDGNALDAAAVSRAVTGADAVVQSLGVALTPQTVIAGTTLFSDTTRVLVGAMAARSVPRLIAVTGIGAGDSRDALGPVLKAAFQLSLRRIYDDKDVQELIIRRSALAWTIVRPGFLTSGASPRYRALLEQRDWRAGPITRVAVARFIVDHLEGEGMVRQTPLLIA